MTAISIKEKAANVRSMIERSRGQIAAALPKHLTAERMMRVCNTAISKTPALLDCDPRTLIGAIVQASQLGLEPDGTLGHAYLIPFANRKTGKTECQFMPGYKGLIELARRSSQISTIFAQVVHENDDWSFNFGLDPQLHHRPTAGEPGPVIAAYAVAKLRDGGAQFEWLWKREVDAIRAQSRAGNSGPWVTHYEEMSKKTALRRLCKILPTSPELTRAVALDEQAEASVPQSFDVFPAELPEEPAETVDATPADRVVKALKGPRTVKPGAANRAAAVGELLGAIAEAGTLDALDEIRRQANHHHDEGVILEADLTSIKAAINQRISAMTNADGEIVEEPTTAGDAG
jgi:recombination protein RecT